MNQYERIVSYIYQYEKEEKGANAGYAKLEKRGNQCRFSVQIRAVALNEIPKVYFYRQYAEGIQTVYAGSMVFRGNNMIWKASAEADGLFGSSWNLEDVDGIFIDGADNIYFATSWKQDRFYRGNWKNNSMNVEYKAAAVQDSQSNATSEQKVIDRKAEKEEIELVQSDVQAEIQIEVEKTVSPSSEGEGVVDEISNLREDLKNKALQDTAENTMQNEIQMQSICGVCPFKRKVYDYGKKLLMTFPSMKPFQNGVAKACVRMELQDIGCLPISTWPLSGNRFLLHGYYCYRHLLFAQLSDDKYVLGVPGIFSEKDRQNALRFGFSDFQSIGEFGKQQGAFGYWFLELPKENDTFENN